MKNMKKNLTLNYNFQDPYAKLNSMRNTKITIFLQYILLTEKEFYVLFPPFLTNSRKRCNNFTLNLSLKCIYNE